MTENTTQNEQATNEELPSPNTLTNDERKLLESLQGNDLNAALLTMARMFEKQRKPDETDADYEYRTRYQPRADELLPYDLKAGLVYSTDENDIPEALWGEFTGYAAIGNRADNFCNAIAIHARLVQDWKLHVNFADPQWADDFKNITLAIQDVLNKSHG